MAPSTAILLLLFALTLGLRSWVLPALARELAHATAAVALVVAVGVLLQEFAGINPAWDLWLSVPPDAASVARGIGRMSILTAGFAVVLALSLLATHAPLATRHPRISLAA